MSCVPANRRRRKTAEDAVQLGLFSDGERYDLSAVGRVKMNMRLGLDTDDTVRILRLEDILEVLKTLTDLRDGRGEVDDIDNLGNRRDALGRRTDGKSVSHRSAAHGARD
ncbi:MAG: hypothetical protein R3C27_13580 [Hyphomonadaceae bacterium]